MKKLTNYIFTALLLLITAGLQAQVVEVCAGDGTDSVTLSLAQYQYGNIQWQYSEDTLTWTDILGAHDTVFRCLPEQECYYRARIEYPNCPVDTTQVTHILFTPTANAGPDRILNEGYVTTLFGNKVEDGNTRCMWQVIEGESPDLEDPTYRNSRFTGPDTLYKLTWTVANACGVSTDTVEIRYVHTVMYDAIVVVDTTDIILSDSAERASGIYRIVFGNPVPNITDSTVLMSMTDGGFLRKVLWFDHFGDTCEMVTAQAYLTDIIVDGVLNIEIPLFAGTPTSRRNTNVVGYTRASLQSDPRYLSGRWGELISEMASVAPRARDFFEGYVNIGSFQLDQGWQISDLRIDTRDLTAICDVEVDWRHLHLYYKMGLIGDVRLNFTLHTEGDAAVTISHTFKTPIQIPLGPVVLGINVPVSISGSCETSQSMDIPMHITKPLDMIAEYSGPLPLPSLVTGLFLPIPAPNSLSENNGRTVVSADETPSSLNFKLSGSVGVRFSALLFEILGPQFSIMPTFTLSVCEGTNGFRQMKSYFSLDTRLDIGLDLLGHFEAGFFHEWPGNQDVIHYSPYRLARGPQTNRNFAPPAVNAYISQPLKVQLFNWVNQPAKSGKKVLFETSDGELSTSPSGTGSASVSAYTDLNGIAQIYWKPNNAVAPTLKASVLDCEGNHIEGSPLFFYAENACANSTLSLDVVGGRLVSSGYSGDYGYLFLEYSSDNINWTNPASNLYPLVPGTTYYVKDNNGCKAATTYTVQESIPDCNLGISTQQNGMTVLMVASNGTAPYHYYVDGVDQTPGGYSNWRWQHTFTQEGDHSLAVSDANGCTMNTVVSVSDGITFPTVATSTTYNTVHNVYDQVMGAVTDNGGAPILERGVQWSLSSDMSNATNVTSSFTGDGLGRFVCNISGVSVGTTYYARAYATNSKGPGYGNIISITMPGSAPIGSTNSCDVNTIRSNETGSDGTITAVRDHENNSYAVVQIGNQCWLKENMRCTTSPSTGANMVWNHASGLSFTDCLAYYYNDDPANAANGYGLLYNWPAAMDGNRVEGSRGICPEGWHVPTDADWTTLMNTAVGIYQPGVIPSPAFGSQESGFEGVNTSIAQMLSDSSDYANGELMNQLELAYQSGAIAVDVYNEYIGHLEDPLGGATFFSMNPAGICSGNFTGRGSLASVWSSARYGTSAFSRNLSYFYSGVTRELTEKRYALSVRCIRDGIEGIVPAVPVVTTSSVINIMSSAVCGGTVVSHGGSDVTARGVCWSTNPNPTVNGSHTVNGIDTGSFVCNITGLSANTTYYVRAYATNGVGTAYGNEVAFTTEMDVPDGQPCPGSPVVTDIDGNTYNTVRIGNQCWMKENLRTTRYADGTNIPSRYAPCRDENKVATYGYLYDWPAVMHGAASSNSNQSGVQGICPTGWHLPSDSEWTQLTDYVGSVARYRCNGESGNVAKALASPLEWQTDEGLCCVGNDVTLNNATSFSALPAGFYNPGGANNFTYDAVFWCATANSGSYGSLNYSFGYRRSILNRSATVNRSSFDNDNGFSVRCVKNGDGTSAAVLPTVSTSAVENVTTTTATCGGNVTSDGGANVTARGVCWSTNQNPTISDNHTTDGSGVGSFTSNISGLTAGNTYYVRAYATNSVGTAYGNEVSVTVPGTTPGPGNNGQPCPGTSTVSDYDGNVYNTVQIGQQCWMKENLRATHYADGTAIPAGGSATSSADPYYYDYSSSGFALAQRGYLYNWPAVMRGAASSTANPSGVQGICPGGWHVPSDAEWTQLTDYVGGQIEYICGGNTANIAKALASELGWSSYSGACTPGDQSVTENNATGFSAVPAGYCYGSSFGTAGHLTYVWSSTQLNSYDACSRGLDYGSAGVGRYTISKRNGRSVRCLRD